MLWLEVSFSYICHSPIIFLLTSFEAVNHNITRSHLSNKHEEIECEAVILLSLFKMIQYVYPAVKHSPHQLGFQLNSLQSVHITLFLSVL